MTTSPQPVFFHHNDCSPAPRLRPATHWLYQNGKKWVAVWGEDVAGWWSGEDVPAEVMTEFLVKDIADVPTTHTLCFYNTAGDRVEISAVEFAAQTNR